LEFDFLFNAWKDLPAVDEEVVGGGLSELALL
jgi:hypothetical protein